MKVLHANDHYARAGGAEVILFNTLDALEERGVVNVAVHQHPATIQESRQRLYRIPGLGDARPARAATVAEAFRDVLRQEQPDVIHLHDIGNPQISEISCAYGPTVQSVYNHSFYCPGGMKYLPFLGRVCERPLGVGCLASAFLTHCNSIRPRVLFPSYTRSRRMLRTHRSLTYLVLSLYQADCLVQSGYPRARVQVLPPFTELPALNQLVRGESSARPMVLFAGRIVREKGLELLLQSVTMLKVPFHLVVSGDGPAVVQAKRLARDLGLAGDVEFVGWAPREQLLGYYRRASVVVVPSVWPEPFGMVGIEAMSYGKPVVAFRVGGIPEWLEDGVTGYLVPPGDLQGMAAKIRNVLEHPDVAHAMGMQGRRKVEEEFGRAAYTTALLKIYSEAIHTWAETEVHSS